MKTIRNILITFAIALLAYSACYAETGLSIIGTMPTQQQYTVTSSSPVAVIAADGTNVGWTVYVEGSNKIRCASKVPNIALPTPTFEFNTGIYINNFPSTNPTVELDCEAESSTATVDVWIDHR